MRICVVVACLALLLFSVAMSAQTTLRRQAPGPPRYSPSSSLVAYTEPEDSKVENGSYSNQYFKLSLPLLAGWQEDVKGPIPSVAGYYVLGRLRTRGDLKGTISIDAQDVFFAPFLIDNAMDFAKRRQDQAVSMFQDVIDRPAEETRFGSRQFARMDYTGAGYHHAVFSTVVRCHVVTIEITSRFPEVFKKLEDNMSQISLDKADPASGGEAAPVCVKDYASGATILHKVDPVLGPLFTQIPVRFVIDTKGKVKHIHVIRSLPDQAKTIEDALAQWLFKPYVQNGQPVELETGILFEFPPRNRRQETAASKH